MDTDDLCCQQRLDEFFAARKIRLNIVRNQTVDQSLISKEVISKQKQAGANIIITGFDAN